MIFLVCVLTSLQRMDASEEGVRWPRTLAEDEIHPDEPGPQIDKALLLPTEPLPGAFQSDPPLTPGSPAQSAPEEPARNQEPETPHGSIPGFLHSHTSAAAWRDFVWRDYLTQPEVLLPLGLAASAAIISHWDKPLENRAMGIWGQRKDIADATAGVLIGGAVLLGGLLPGDGRNWWDELWDVGEAYGLSTLAAGTLKIIVWRHRPGPGGRNRSFPSGHSTAAFTGAALIELNSGEALGIPAYALATACAISRMDTGDHYPSDVLAGASIGVLTAAILDALHWGTGREGQGIARPGAPHLELGVLPEGGVDLGFAFGF